jgi:hypothetical protein
MPYASCFVGLKPDSAVDWQCAALAGDGIMGTHSRCGSLVALLLGSYHQYRTGCKTDDFGGDTGATASAQGEALPPENMP